MSTILTFPNFTIEEENFGLIAGIDEAGRGPLAGPVVSACVVLDRNNYPLDLNDSKKLSKIVRERIFLELQKNARFGVGIVDESIIDQINILNATKLSMKLAFSDFCQKYQIKPDLVLVDGNFIPQIDVNAKFIIKGDEKSLSIAAASIIAKETRDNIMKNLSIEFPHYGWEKNQAYATKFHLEKIKEIGICKYHRKSFAPVRNCYESLKIASL